MTITTDITRSSSSESSDWYNTMTTVYTDAWVCT